MVYAIVRAGGRQEKVSVGDLVTLDRVPAEAGSSIELPALMVVDGDKVTSEKKELDNIKVSAEVLEHLRGKKVVIQKFKNKTGYKKRQGHRQNQTKVKITSIA
ncbi:50S ribosomal protein L21 [Auritidibacter ignavus]|uniref:50S ribosomal protein L21 n=1 Tax=Auritidibacter ignavus TaxID=678932 RepID=UPI0024B9C1B2|nr:50S ribosomal protein L21 [Auritidibacter ignavus]WHS28124.1 50S ribosomal protein L21 [Auritidibacter ignavus]